VIDVNMDDAVNKVSFNVVDQNNTPITKLDIKSCDPGVSEFFAQASGISFLYIPAYEYWDPIVLFNNMGTRFSFQRELIFYTGDDWYHYNYLLNNGITEDVIVENTGSELVHHQQFFNVNNEPEGSSYAYLGVAKTMYDPQADIFGDRFSGFYVFDSELIHDREKPFSVYSNVKTIENPQPGDFNITLFPIFYENDYFDEVLWEYNHTIFSTPFGVNNDDQIVMHTYPFNSFWEKQTELTTNDPLALIYESGEIVFNKFRTPHLYYQSQNDNPLINPFTTENVLSGVLIFMGENGEQRYIDNDVLMTVKLNETTLFKGSVNEFNISDFYGVEEGFINWM